MQIRVCKVTRSQMNTKGKEKSLQSVRQVAQVVCTNHRGAHSEEESLATKIEKINIKENKKGNKRNKKK